MLRRITCASLLLLLAFGCQTGSPGGGGGNDNASANDNSGGGADNDNSGGGGGDGGESDWPQEARLTAFDPAFEDLWGDDVAATEDKIAVGTEVKNNLAGVVDVYSLFAGEWTYRERLVGGPARFPEQSFGSSVAISNRHVFVGAQKYSIEGSLHIQRGAVYVFEDLGSRFEQRQLLTIPDGEDFEYFGNAMAYEPDQSHLIVGAFGRGGMTGAAYTFKFNGATFDYQDRLTASDAAGFEDFGAAVAMHNVWAVVGAPGKDFGTGAAYVFEREVDDWVETQILAAPDAAQTDQFGTSVAIEKRTIVVGASAKKRPGDDLLNAGAVYIYERSGGDWSHVQTLVPTDEFAGLFGASVAITDDIIAVGIEGKGLVVLYEHDGNEWTMTGVIGPDQDPGVDSFGHSIALVEGRLVVGARSANAGNQRAAGAVYVFTPESEGSDGGSGGIKR